jgi:ribosome-binding factor A
VSNRNRRWKNRARSASVEDAFVQALFDDDRERDSDRKPFDARQDRKTLQLCRQVQRALMLALGGECADDLLRDVYIESVSPMGSASQLMVRVALPANGRVPSLEILARLNERSPKLRAAIAQSICRKRVPNLAFVAVHTADGPDAGERGQQP